MSFDQMDEFVEEAVSILDRNVEPGDGFLWTGGKEAQVIAHMLLEEVGKDVTFLTVDTGNHFESIYNFRESFHEEKGFDWKVRKHEELLEKINDPEDPRDYHGEWSSEAERAGEIDITKEEWTVERSCGTLKVVPMRRFIERDGFDTLITGVRASDPVAGEEFGPVVEKKEPAEHTRVNPLHNWSENHVWAYLKKQFVDYPDIYDEGYRHTDSKCCTDDSQVGEHGEGGRDPEKTKAKDKLQEMGYV